MKFGNFSVTDYLLIEYGEGKFASVMPVKEREFVELLEKKMSEKRMSGKRMSEKNMEGAGAAGSQEEEPPVLDE